MEIYQKTSREMPTPDQLKGILLEAKALPDVRSNLWEYFVLRPISFRLTPLFIRLGFSANAVTALGMLLLICGLVFISLGATHRYNFIIGAALINISILLDYIDGNIARWRGQSSQFGALFDHIVGQVYCSFQPICLGLGLYLSSPEHSMFALGLEAPRWVWLVIGAVQSSSGLLSSEVRLRARGVVGLEERRRREITLGLVSYKTVGALRAPLFLIAALVGMLKFFLLGYAVFNLAALFATIGLFLRKAMLADRCHPEGQLP